MTAFNGSLYFPATTAAQGTEPWRTDGVTTAILQELNPGGVSSNPFRFTPFAGQLYFRATSAAAGSELFRTDGVWPVATTGLFADVDPGAPSSDPSELAAYAGDLYFRAGPETTGNELWRTDGTTFELVSDINPGPEDSNPSDFTPYAGKLYFGAENGNDGYELWSTDGTRTGLFKDILPGSDSGEPYGFTPFDGDILFPADDGTRGWELWKVADADRKVSISILGNRLAVGRKAGRAEARVRLRCPADEQTGPCRGRLTLTARGAGTLVSGSFSVAAGKTRTVALRMSRRSGKLVTGPRAVRSVTATAKVRDGAGNSRTVRKTLRVG
jgi:ELWxxDGT repeat protein